MVIGQGRSGVVKKLRSVMGLLLVAFSLLFVSGLRAEEIPVEKRGGVYYIPIEVNNALTLDFIIDTGAAEVTLPADVVSTLMRTGDIAASDYLPSKVYILADGSEMESPRILLREIKIGSNVLKNVPASISDTRGPLLLGQSLLERLGHYSIDSKKLALILKRSEIQHEADPPAEAQAFAQLDEKRMAQNPQEAVEIFLRSVASKQFLISWKHLTPYSQKKIIEMVSEEERNLSPEDVRALFDENHFSVQSGFWMAYRESSRIPEFLPQANFQKSKEAKGNATITVSTAYQKIDFDVYEDDGVWKLGLIETLENRAKK